MLELFQAALTVTLMMITPVQADDENVDLFSAPADNVEEVEPTPARTVKDVEDDMCTAAESVMKYSGIIDEQEKIGKVSGFVDKHSMQHAGEVIVRRSDELKTLRNEYKTRTGKTYSHKMLMDKCGS